MALRSGTPVNLSALRRDYSALPQIAAIKAQANQGIFNAIKEGIDNRKQKIKDAAETKSRQNVIQEILNTDLGKRVFGDSLPSAKDIDIALGKDGQKNLVSILDILGKADIEEDKIRAAAQEKRIKDIRAAIKRDLMSKALTSTGGLNITPDMIDNISKTYKVPFEVVAGLRGEVINGINTIGNEKLEAEFKRDPNFRKYVDGLRTLDPKDANLHEDLFDANSVFAMLGGALGGGAGVALGMGAVAGLPVTLGILGGAALGGLGIAEYNKWKGKKEFEREGFDFPSIQSYNEVLFRNPEMIQAAGLNGIFDVLGGKRLNETVGGEELVLGNNTTVTAFGLGNSDSVPTENLSDQIQQIRSTPNSNTGTALADPTVSVTQGGKFVPYFERNPPQGSIQLKQNSQPTQKQLSPEQVRMIQQIMMNQVPGV
tara:strand:+ start:36 stop:1319 length:1284 start_codon:yes stop_codon:yes gene_type:complete